MQLMFLATRTRPDEPSAADEVCLHRVIGYLAEYKDLELHCKVTDLQLHAYFDAGWACHSDMKDHSGMVLTLGSNLVHDYAYDYHGYVLCLNCVTASSLV